MKRVLAPPSPERLKAINDVVSGVLGLQTERGDRLVIESLPFEQTLLAENIAPPQSQDKKPASNPKDQLNTLFHDKRVLIGAGAGGTVLVAALAFLVLRSKKKRAAAQASMQAQLGAAQAAEAVKQTALPATESENVLVAAFEEGDPEGMVFPKLQISAKSRRFEELRSHIRDSVNREPQMAADVLRDWLSERR
jgi:flagellar biosynthesis/type III secretory pathway M-ring protein FliF/YscJ